MVMAKDGEVAHSFQPLMGVSRSFFWGLMEAKWPIRRSRPDCKLLELSLDNFEAFYQKHPGNVLDITQIVIRRYQETMTKLTNKHQLPLYRTKNKLLKNMV